MKAHPNMPNRTSKVLNEREVRKLAKDARRLGFTVTHRRKVKQIELYAGGDLQFRAVSNGDAFWVADYNQELFD